MNDLRPIYFHEARERLVGNRLAVYEHLLRHGPKTGTGISMGLGWPVTSIRPRLCELRMMRAAVTTGRRIGGEHEFRACSHEEMQAAHVAQRRELARAEDNAKARHAQYVENQLWLLA